MIISFIGKTTTDWPDQTDTNKKEGATPDPSIRRGTGDSAAKIIKNLNTLLQNTENVAFMRAWQINLHKNSIWKLMCIMCIIDYPYYSHSFQKKINFWFNFFIHVSVVKSFVVLVPLRAEIIQNPNKIKQISHMEFCKILVRFCKISRRRRSPQTSESSIILIILISFQ
jgi:hypothetical protein